MSDLESEIIALLEDAPGNHASHAYIINEVDLLDADYSLTDLNESLDNLREERRIRIHRPNAPIEDRQIELLE